MSDYTPTTEEVRAAYIGKPAHWLDEQIGTKFDRWLALHDAEVTAAAMYPQKPGAWEWDPEYIARYEQGMAAAENYATGIEPSRRAETIDDFMTGWRIASETPRPVGEEKHQ